MQLYIGNKNYSTWSMRPWVLMRQFDIPFDEVMVRFDSFKDSSQFKQRMLKISPAGRVPVLVDDELAVWDTMAIVETLAEKFPQHALWPRAVNARARARSICAEMHAGFGALRTHCPMNISASLPEIGVRLMQEQPAVVTDLKRVIELWQQALRASGGPFLFGSFCNADAYYAPVVMRIRTYSLPVPNEVRAYCDRIHNSTAVQAWVNDAMQEHDFVEEDEPYRKPPVK